MRAALVLLSLVLATGCATSRHPAVDPRPQPEAPGYGYDHESRKTGAFLTLVTLGGAIAAGVALARDDDETDPPSEFHIVLCTSELSKSTGCTQGELLRLGDGHEIVPAEGNCNEGISGIYGEDHRGADARRECWPAGQFSAPAGSSPRFGGFPLAPRLLLLSPRSGSGPALRWTPHVPPIGLWPTLRGGVRLLPTARRLHREQFVTLRLESSPLWRERLSLSLTSTLRMPTYGPARASVLGGASLRF